MDNLLHVIEKLVLIVIVILMAIVENDSIDFVDDRRLDIHDRQKDSIEFQYDY